MFYYFTERDTEIVPDAYNPVRLYRQVWHVKKYARIKDAITITTVYKDTVCHRMPSALLASQCSLVLVANPNPSNGEHEGRYN